MKNDEITQKILVLLAQKDSRWTTLTLASQLDLSPYRIWKIVTSLQNSSEIEIIPLSKSGKISSHSFLKLKII